MTSSWNPSITQSSRQPRNCRRLVSSIDGFSTGAEAAVAFGLDRTVEVGVHFEAAREHLRLHHLADGLTGFGVLAAPVDHQLDLRVACDPLVRRQRGVAQRDHRDDTDRQPDDDEHEPERGGQIP